MALRISFTSSFIAFAISSVLLYSVLTYRTFHDNAADQPAQTISYAFIPAALSGYFAEPSIHLTNKEFSRPSDTAALAKPTQSAGVIRPLRGLFPPPKCDRLVLKECLGGGTFGAVFHAVCLHYPFANSTKYEEFHLAVKYAKSILFDDDVMSIPYDEVDEEWIERHGERWPGGDIAWHREVSTLIRIHSARPTDPKLRNIIKIYGLVSTNVQELYNWRDNLKEGEEDNCMELFLPSEEIERSGDSTNFQGLAMEYSAEPDLWVPMHSWLHNERRDLWKMGPPSVMKERWPLVYDNMYDILIGIARGMSALHERDILHRDIFDSTKNILLKSDSIGYTSLVHDLGLALYCPAELGQELQKMEMYFFGNFLYLACFRNEGWEVTERFVDQRNMPCDDEEWDVIWETKQKLRYYHDENHPGLSDGVDSDMYQCRNPQMLDLMMECWNGILSNNGPKFPWPYVISWLESMKAKDPRFYQDNSDSYYPPLFDIRDHQ